MVSKDNYEECMQRLLDKYNLLNQNKPKNSNRNINKTNKNTHKNQKNQQNQQNTNKNNNLHNNTQNRNMQKPNFKYNIKLKDTTWVEPDAWLKLSRDDKLTIIENRDNMKKANTSQRNEPSKASQFNHNKNNNRFVKVAESHEEVEDVNEDDETIQRSNNTPCINSIMTSIRHLNPIMCNSSIQEVKSLALIDSGADTCMLSEDDFYIEAQYDHRRVTIEGFSGITSAVRNLRIGKGITAVDIDNKTILLRVNEGVITPFKTIILTNQVRNFGHKVDDVPQKYHGTQSIKLTDDHTLNLVYNQALIWLPIRKPSRRELNTLEVIDLTDPSPWNPKLNECDEGENYTIEVDDYGYHMDCKATTERHLDDMTHIQRCLGWKSMDVIKRTLENTTQLAENTVRLPMRMHYKSRFPALNVN